MQSIDLLVAAAAGLSIHRFPETKEEADRAEDILSQEMEKIGLVEHEKIIFDLHGVSTCTCTGTAVLQSVPVREGKTSACISAEQKLLLQALQRQLDTMCTIASTTSSSKADGPAAAYKEAKFLNSAYVTNPHFCLQFLRANQFDIAATAQMILFHYKTKKRLFGSGAILARDVLQSDLTTHDVECLKMGCVQLLPTQDAAGRSVIVTNISLLCKLADDGHRQLELERSLWYFSMATLQDMSHQGAVGVSYQCHFDDSDSDANNNAIIDRSCFDSLSQLELCFPIRQLANHICYDQPSLRPLVAGYLLFRHDRSRIRAHLGASMKDLHSKLQTEFGIPVDDSPLQEQPDDDGGHRCYYSWSLSSHHQWLGKMKKREEEAFKVGNAGGGGTVVVSTCIIPHQFDVLFGKSHRARLAPGTQRALALVDSHYQQYYHTSGNAVTTKYDKTKLADKLIAIIRSSGGRFLKQQQRQQGESRWIQVPDVTARQKIAHWFRHKKPKKAAHKS